VDFVLALHSHLPYVLRHGRWPHGSDWLCEAALDSYLPLIEKVHELASRGVRAPVTIGISPVLANQLADPFFGSELDAFFAQRLESCGEARRTLPQTGDGALLPLVDFWEARFRKLQERFETEGRDIAAAFARLEAAGDLEVMTCAATHGYLPLLARDESIRLQLAVAVAEHRRIFGRAPAGCWLPECGYRPGGWWEPLPRTPHAGLRAGIEEHLAAAGIKFFFTDAHLARAGSALGGYAGVPIGAERFGAVRRDRPRHGGDGAWRTPYRAYLVASPGTASPVAVLVRDPRSSMQVWSRDLGSKRPYDPAAALAQVAMHASHFASLLASEQQAGGAAADGVIAAPFDTELFGHWWFEGVDFLGSVYRNLGDRPLVRSLTASEHLREHPPRAAIELAAGSWGAGGDHGMWLNEQTHWTWRRLWPLEDRFWDVAPRVLGAEGAGPVLAQAARELLLAQASDWQFIITTGAVSDYAERRFTLHAEDAERLVGFLESAAGGSLPGEAARMAEELYARDAIFPDVLRQVESVVGQGSAAGRL
jgi:1,4-alpha-glucan branching enzyme